MNNLCPLEHLFQDRCFTGILEFRIKSIDDEIEKGRQRGETVSFGVLLVPGGHAGKKGMDFILSDGLDFPLAKFSLEFRENELVTGERIFFGNLLRDNPDRILRLVKFSCDTSSMLG